MPDAIITRKVGGGRSTKEPTLNLVSKSFDNIVFTITNNDSSTVDVF